MKAVVADTDRAAYGTTVLRPNARVLGPRIGKDVQAVIKAAKAGDWEQNADGSVTVAGHKLVDGEFELALQTSGDQAAAPVRMLDPEGRSQDLGLVVALDTDVTPELYAEGVARDLVRLVQQARKAAGLDVTDRIALTLQLPEAQRAMVESAHRVGRRERPGHDGRVVRRRAAGHLQASTARTPPSASSGPDPTDSPPRFAKHSGRYRVDP